MDRTERPQVPILSFLGAADSVTGSRFLIETNKSTVLIDCGLFQGHKKIRGRNWDPFPMEVGEIDAVVITHAHIDHIGYLPRLRKQGFAGPVYCTQGTADLAAIVLPDSGHLHEEEAKFANRVGYSKHRPALPLYTEAEARATLALLRPIPFSEATPITEDVVLTLKPAGHILGSAIATIDLANPDRRVVFSGDLGRGQHPLLRPPAPPDDADVIVMESTYGGRFHDDPGTIDQLALAITQTAQRGGTVVIPAFAVDRTEVVLFRLRELVEAGAIPSLPIYVDSPMALRALRVYREAIASGADDIRPELRGRPEPFDTGQLHEIRDVEDSKGLASAPHPSIIISASGMATGGRILHHLARLLPDGRNTLVLVGFQAAGTRGRRLANGEPEIKLLGKYVRVRADVANLRSFSVHADHGELMGWLGSATRPPDTTYIVHGEASGALALHDAIESELDWPAVVPRHLERVRLA